MKNLKKIGSILLSGVLSLGVTGVSPAEELTGETANRAIDDAAFAAQDDVADVLFGAGQIGSRVIWGSDQLQVVDEARRRTFPFSAVVAIQAEFSSGYGQSTGFVIGRNTILTCGHCVYDPEYGGLCQSLELYPGSDESSRPFGVYYASPSDVSIYPKWLDSAQKAGTGSDWYSYTEHGYDIAIIRVSEPIGDVTGYFNLSYQEGTLNGLSATLTGYPMGWRMKTANGIISDSDENSLIYQIDSEPGTSGCPIYREDRNGTLAVIGVNKSSRVFTNQASRLTAEKVNWITSQVSSGDAQLIQTGLITGTNEADFSVSKFNEGMYAGSWQEIVSGYKAYVPSDWTQAGTSADHIYSVSNEDDELFMALSTENATLSAMATDLLEILKHSESLDPLKLLSGTGAIMDFFSDISNWGDVSGSLTGDIVINGIEAKTNSMNGGDIYLQAIRFEGKSGDGIVLLAGNLSLGKLSPTMTNLLDSFQEN